ncbi:MAG: hypothetical protein OCD03_00435 [Hyphomicrobiales bacterium]
MKNIFTLFALIIIFVLGNVIYVIANYKDIDTPIAITTIILVFMLGLCVFRSLDLKNNYETLVRHDGKGLVLAVVLLISFGISVAILCASGFPEEYWLHKLVFTNGEFTGVLTFVIVMAGLGFLVVVPFILFFILLFMYRPFIVKKTPEVD